MPAPTPRYWVGGGSSSNWSAITPTNWSTTSGGSNNASVPASSNSVIFDGAGTNGNTNSTISAAISIFNLTVSSGYTKIITHNGGLIVTVTGATFDLRGGTGFAYTLVNASTSALSFTATDANYAAPTQIWTNGQTLGNVSCSDAGAVGANVQPQDNMTLNTTATLTLTSGTFDANGKNMSVGLLSSTNANTRTLTMGTGTWSITGSGGNIFDLDNNSGMTLTRGSNPFNFTYSLGVGTRTIRFSNAGTGGVEGTTPDILVSAGTDTVSTAHNGGTENRYHNLDFTGFGGTLSNAQVGLYGNLTLNGTMIITAGTNVWTWRATSGTQQITSNTATMDFPVTFNGVSGTFQLQDAMTVGSTRLVTITNGTLNANNNNFTMGSFATAAGTKVIQMGTGTWELQSTAAATIWNVSATNFTVTPSTSTIKISGSTTNIRTFAGASLTYAGLWYTNATDAGQLTITGTNTFTTFRRDASDNNAQTILFPNVTTTVTNFLVSGSASHLVTLIRTGASGTFTLSQTSGNVCSNYLSISNSAATGGATWKAGANSTDGGGNTGWSFTSCASGNMLLCF